MMLLQVDKLTISFRQRGTRVAVVDGISFEIERGETFCLVGESGSGKSLTALSIARLLPENARLDGLGTVSLWDGDGTCQDLLRADESALREVRGSRIAMIFQEPMSSLNPVLTLGEQIVEAIQLTWPERPPEVTWQLTLNALRKVQLEHPERRIDEYPHRLSGGQRQRAMIAMAIACEPDLLIADEPTSALDVTVQAGILALLRALQSRTGMSMLFITHDLGVVARIADRVAVMRRGKIVEQGVTSQVLHAPRHAYTKNLIDNLPENLVRERRVLAHRHAERAGDEPLIRIDELCVHYPVRRGVLRRVSEYVRAVDGVSLSLERGQIVTLVGESGCGKTTLGRALLRLVPARSGAIYFRGWDITRASQAHMRRLRPKLQYIFQDPIASLNPRLRIATTLVEPMAAHGIGDSHRHRLQLAEQALLDVQLEPRYLWRFPQQFSGGQRQRIGIARALCLQPEFIVCDEITSALDVSVQAGILDLLLALRDQRGVGLLFITHDIGVVEYIGDITAVMYCGKIAEVGTTAQVCKQPHSPYTRQLLAAVPRVGDRANTGDRPAETIHTPG